MRTIALPVLSTLLGLFQNRALLHLEIRYCQLKRKLPRFRLLKALPATNNQEVTAQ